MSENNENASITEEPSSASTRTNVSIDESWCEPPQEEETHVARVYVAMETQPQQQPPEEKKTRCQRWTAEILDLGMDLFQYSRAENWKKKAIIVGLWVVAALVLTDLFFFGNIVEWLHDFVLWMEDHVALGIFGFIALFAITTLIFIPPSILIFAAGYIFSSISGLWMGIIAATMACFIGSVIGAIIAFFRARYTHRNLVRLFARRYKIVRAADRAIQHNGFRVMLLLRLCSVIPFSALNYIGGITGVSWEVFCASLIGILPLILLTTTTGATAETLILTARQDGEWPLSSIILACSGLAFFLIAIFITAYFCKKELQKELQAAANEESSFPEEEGFEIDYEVGVDDEEWFWMFA